MGESEPSCMVVVRVNFSVMMLCLCHGAVDHVLSLLFPKTELKM